MEGSVCVGGRRGKACDPNNCDICNQNNPNHCHHINSYQHHDLQDNRMSIVTNTEAPPSQYLQCHSSYMQSHYHHLLFPSLSSSPSTSSSPHPFLSSTITAYHYHHLYHLFPLFLLSSSSLLSSSFIISRLHLILSQYFPLFTL